MYRGGNSTTSLESKREQAIMAAMFGPDLLVRTLSKAVPFGKKRDIWQYHSRGDRHSKAACWGVLLDLMRSSQLLREHAEGGRVAFGINHEMKDFKQNRKKDLDLVLCTPAGPPTDPKRTFASLATEYEFELSDRVQRALHALPVMHEAPVASVLVALEAKACMTAHVKAIPRLFDELNSSHQTIHGASQMVIAAGLVMVNAAPFFVSPGRVGYCPKCGHRVSPVNQHKQPADALRVVKKVEELPRRASVQDEGYDALAIVAVDCRNDGSPVTLLTKPPAPPSGDILAYDQMIARLAHLYEARFPRI